MRNLGLRWTRSGHFFSKTSGQLFQILKRAEETSRLSPVSYTQVLGILKRNDFNPLITPYLYSTLQSTELVSLLIRWFWDLVIRIAKPILFKQKSWFHKCFWKTSHVYEIMIYFFIFTTESCVIPFGFFFIYTSYRQGKCSLSINGMFLKYNSYNSMTSER